MAEEIDYVYLLLEDRKDFDKYPESNGVRYAFDPRELYDLALLLATSLEADSVDLDALIIHFDGLIEAARKIQADEAAAESQES